MSTQHEQKYFVLISLVSVVVILCAAVSFFLLVNHTNKIQREIKQIESQAVVIQDLSKQLDQQTEELNKQLQELEKQVKELEALVSTFCTSDTEKQEQLIERIIRINPNANQQVVCETVKAAFNSQTDRVNATEILALVQISSGFDLYAVGQGKADKPIGLTQIRTGMWQKLIGDRDMTEISNQVQVAVEILEQNLSKTGGDKQAAVSAYSTGITAYTMYNSFNTSYVEKFELAKHLIGG